MKAPGNMTSNELITILGSLGGGAIMVKVIELFTFSKKDKIDAAMKMITALQDEVKIMEGKMQYLTDEVNTWRGKYLDLREEYSSLLIKYQGMEQELKQLKKN